MDLMSDPGPFGPSRGIAMPVKGPVFERRHTHFDRPLLEPEKKEKTMFRKLLIPVAIAVAFAFASPAQSATGGPGEVRWFVDDATNVIVNSTSFASVPIPPGHTAVLKSVVDAACSCASRMRGLWDGTTYTLPASLRPQTTDAGQLKVAARRLYQQLLGLSEGLAGVASYWPREDVSLGHDLMAYAHRGVRGVVLSPSWTVAQKITMMQQMAFGALDVTSPGEFLRADRGRR